MTAEARIVAQSRDSVSEARIPRLEIAPYVGGARHSLVGTHLGVTPNRDHLFLGVHATVNLARTVRWAFGYAPEVVPLLLLSNNPTYRKPYGPPGIDWPVETGRGPVAGFAVSPVGLEAQRRVTPRTRIFASGAGGVVWFTREVPSAYSRAFNYTFEAGGGLL